MRLSHVVKAALLCVSLVALCRAAAQAPAPWAPAPAPAPVGPCCPDCAPPKKICVADVEKRTITRTKYDCKCQTICLPSCGALLGGCCGCDHSGECGKPREVRRLYKRFVKEEQCQPVCKPVDAPCRPANCAAPCPAPAACPAR
jgi:hypothetical protein